MTGKALKRVVVIRQKGERGMVMLLALLALLVLSSVALAGLQSVANHLARAGTYRVSAIAYGVTEAGSEATMALAAINPNGFNDFVAAHNYRITMGDVSPIFFDTGPGGSFGREVGIVGGANWISSLSLPISSHRAPGYAIGEYCFRKYYSTTDGTYGDQAVQSPDDLLRNPRKRFFSTIFVGPVECF